ncbi:MAG TPA: hypothetical protein VN922_11450 [Bacteroidia bacterium]|nr:hypothetical protein [Bacteroidia bacterium]
MRYIILTLFVGFVSITNAQSIKVITATSQTWSGGVAGHHGINYVIIIECSDTAITPDTVWINGNYFPLSITAKDTANRKVNRKNHTVTYTIYEWEAYNDMDQTHRTSQEQQKANTKNLYRNYDGAALISYRLKHRQHSIIVKQFTQLKPLCYP